MDTKTPVDVEALKQYSRPLGLPFQFQKIGHVVLNVSSLERAVKFYTEVLGMRVSDVYPESLMPGGMVFMRFHHDHHGVAIVGGKASAGTADRPNGDLNHFAFEVATLDEVFLAREHLRKHFEINAESIVAAALSRLVRDGKFDAKKAVAAFAELGVDTEKIDAARA